MRRKLIYVLAGGALAVLLQWAVPAAYSAMAADEEAAQTCPATTACPAICKKAPQAEG
jgi:hypothetical protein